MMETEYFQVVTQHAGAVSTLTSLLKVGRVIIA
jgi:hypothetical protein